MSGIHHLMWITISWGKVLANPNNINFLADQKWAYLVFNKEIVEIMSIYIFSKEVAGSGTQKVITAYKTKQVKDIKTSGTYSNKYVNHLNEMLVKKMQKYLTILSTFREFLISSSICTSLFSVWMTEKLLIKYK